MTETMAVMIGAGGTFFAGFWCGLKWGFYFGRVNYYRIGRNP